MPESPGGTRDDRRLSSVDHFAGRRVIITEKLDGSNLCMTRDAVYARSHAAAPGHPSFDAAKALHARVRDGISPGLSIFGEWCWAVHSIRYEGIPNPPFFVFGVRDDTTALWWAWNLVRDFIPGILGLPVVPQVGPSFIESGLDPEWYVPLAKCPSTFGGEREGLVFRVANAFYVRDFDRSVAKYVRANHVQTDEHWTSKAVERQPLVRWIP